MGKPKTKIALFNYGGGMRGLIPAHFMAEIEDATGLHITDMVDIFCGPSTGAILNAALNVPHPDDPTKPKYKARQMVKFYEREGIKIFPPDRFRDFRGLIHDFNNRTMKIGKLRALFRHGHYNPANLALPLRALYGNTKLSESLRSLIIPVYNLDGEILEIVEEAGESDDAPVHTQNNIIDRGGHAVWLKNMKLEHNQTPTPNVSLYDSILASTAAPTYFPCHHFRAEYSDKRGRVEYSGIDGSIFDNPCISYHGAIRQHMQDDEELVMIALGTGHTLRSFKKDDWNNFGGLGVVDPVNDLPLINILFHAPETALIESFRQEMNGRFYAFNKSMVNCDDPSIVPNTQIDDASEENIKRMRKFFEASLEESRKEFDELCHVLVSSRDEKQGERDSLAKRLSQKVFFLKN